MIFYDYFVAGFIDIPFTFSAWLGLIISRSVLYPKNLLEQKSLWLEHEWISPALMDDAQKETFIALFWLSSLWCDQTNQSWLDSVPAFLVFASTMLGNFLCIPGFFVFFDTNFSNWLLRGEPTRHLFILVHKETGRRSGCRIFMPGSYAWKFLLALYSSFLMSKFWWIRLW